MNTMIVSKAEGWDYYYNDQNRLAQVSGHSGTTTRSYTYDKNGNLLTDSYREIAATEYGRTAYPYYLEADDNEIYYLYSTEDQRMYKKVVTPTETTTEFYLQDATGKTVALRRKVGSAAATWEYYVNGSEREARIKNVTHNGMIAPQEIEFYLYDHLGNTRIVYEPTYAGGVLELAINYATDYFPYGKVLREYVNTSTGDPEKFLTTQHERDKETGLDYRGARFYDSDVARFLSTDPKATKYPSMSPYNYVGGNPIIAIDPDGKEIIIVGQNGQSHTYTPGMTAPQGAGRDVEDIIMGMNFAHANIPEVRNNLNFLVGLQGEGVNIRSTANFGDVNKFFPPTEQKPGWTDVTFNPNQADVLQNGSSQSPLVSLGHEMQHAYNYFDAMQASYEATTPSEVRAADRKIDANRNPEVEEHNATTKGMEPVIAKYLGQGIRSSYTPPIEINNVGCITCTTPVEPSSEKAKQQIKQANEVFKQNTGN